MWKWIVCELIFVIPIVFAEGDTHGDLPTGRTTGSVRSICRPQHPLVREIPTDRRPHYFFRPFPVSEQGSYAGTDENFLVDFSGQGVKETKIPGRWDPVPTPDEQFMTMPTDHRDFEGLAFFQMDDLKNSATKPKPFFEDKQMTGVYQSIGIVGRGNGGSTTYRAIIAQGAELRVRDYTMTPDPMSPQGVRAVAHGETPNKLCHNLGDLELSLPMISKDGKQLAAVDVKAGVTKIYDLSDDGSCKEAINLGIFTGKVDFGYDGDSITFHVFNNEVNGTEYVEVPSDERGSNVYVYKRSKRQMIRITNNTGANAVYPAFRKDGSVVFLQHPHGAAVDSTEKSKLVIVDPRKYDPSLFDQFSTTSPDKVERLKALTAIGILWADHCGANTAGISQQSAVLNTLALDRAACLSLIEKDWDSQKAAIFGDTFPQLKVSTDELKKLAKSDLRDVCPKAATRPNPTPIPTTAPITPPLTRSPSEIIENCKNCHDRPTMPRVPFDAPTQLRRAMTTMLRPPATPTTLAEDIKRRLGLRTPEEGRMPPGEKLKPEEVQALIRYLGL